MKTAIIQERAALSVPPIQVRGVRVHNLQSLDLDIPRGKWVVVCGVSGSGKTSLAMDTLYAEGQRRFIENFSAYTRQYLERWEKPDYDSIDHLPPAIAVGQHTVSRSNRNTVGSASELNDYLRLLFSKCANPICPHCQTTIQEHSPQSVADRCQQFPVGTKTILCFRKEWSDWADLAFQLHELQQAGFLRLVVGDRLVHLGREDRATLSEHFGEHRQAWVAVDRLTAGSDPGRWLDSLETAFHWGDGQILILEALGESDTGSRMDLVVDGQAMRAHWFSRRRRCPSCDLDFPDPDPRLFSFNSPLGACAHCEGLGEISELDWNKIVPDSSLSLAQGAIACWNTPAYQHELRELLDLARDYRLPVDIPVAELRPEHWKLVQQGVPEREFGGLEGFFRWLDRHKYKMHVRIFAHRWRSYRACPACQGQRLNSMALAYRLAGLNLAQISSMEIDQLRVWFTEWSTQPSEIPKPKDLCSQIASRLDFLAAVGVGYLSLDRPLRSLSSGEAQRVALSASLGASLTSMLYVLDEPTKGLHPIETESLVQAILRLRDRGNTIVMVEHDTRMIEACDWLVELGPGAGTRGGQIVYADTPDRITRADTPTGRHLAKRKRSMVIAEDSLLARRPPSGWLRLVGARGNNLQQIDVDFPLGVLCCVTGVSGAGKSSLVMDTLHGAVRRKIGMSPVATLEFVGLELQGSLEDVVLIDQESLPRSSRSNAATYLTILDEIRQVFAKTIDARTSQFGPTHFSFNHELGRCPRCEGDGCLKIDMQFLADLEIECPECKGNRFRSEVLRVKYRDRSIAQVLQMPAQEATDFFRTEPKVRKRIQPLLDVGLDYLPLGQSTSQMSDGEAQRLRLAGFLAASGRGKTLFLMDEPSTGMHPADIQQLLGCFGALVEQGHSLILVEHDPWIMMASDYLIDMGPGASRQGGRVVASGTPEVVLKSADSRTAKVLRDAPF
jgi:excinuclease ABC subunit A